MSRRNLLEHTCEGCEGQPHCLQEFVEEVDADELDKVRVLDKGVMDEGVSDTNQIFGLINQEVTPFETSHVAAISVLLDQQYGVRLLHHRKVSIAAASEPRVMLPQLLCTYSVHHHLIQCLFSVLVKWHCRHGQMSSQGVDLPLQ